MPKKSSKKNTTEELDLFYECECCGGNFQKVKEGEFKCDHCGYVKHVVTASSNEIINLLNEANRLRNKFDFDEAAEVFEEIVKKDPTNCEGYWGLFLCEYGIAHQEDPKTHKYLPTCNRASVVSVFEDKNYQNAISFAGEFQKQDLEESGKQIDEIIKKVVKLSKNEQPYDIFICYKKTSSIVNGEETYTKDSIHAREIYEILTEQGYKVFFAEKTLQNIGGNEYEPIIFNALNTSHVMLVVSSKIEYINAPWVKNEWRRFIKQMEFDESKKLIPIMCGDMTPSKLPDLLRKYQALEIDVNFQKNLLTSVNACLGAVKNSLKKVSIDGVKIAKKSNIVKSAVESRKISTSKENVFKATEQIQLKNALRHFDAKTLNLSDAWVEFNDLKNIPKLKAISEYAIELVKFKKLYSDEKFNKKVLKEIQASPFNKDEFVEKFNACVENVDKDTLDFVFKDIKEEYYNEKTFKEGSDSLKVISTRKAFLYEMIMSWDYEGKDIISKSTYEYILKNPFVNTEKLIDGFIKFYDQKDVDGYIEKLENIADNLANNKRYELAKKYYDKILEVDEGNVKIRWKKYCSGINVASDGNIRFIINELTEKDTNDFKEFLSYIPASQRNSYIHKMVNACTSSLSILEIRQKLNNAQYLQFCKKRYNWGLRLEDIKMCVQGEKTSRKWANKLLVKSSSDNGGADWDHKHVMEIFDAVICLYSEKSTDFLSKDLFDFAENLKTNKFFEDAIKYYDMVVEEGKNEIKHKAYWGILQSKMKCVDNVDMIYSKLSVKDFSEFHSALNCAGEVSEEDVQKYLVVKNEQGKGLKRPKTKKAKAKESHVKTKSIDIIDILWNIFDFIVEHFKAIFFTTAIVVAVGLWAGYTYSPTFMAKGISSVEQLQEIASTKKKGKYYLKKNLDLSSVPNLTFKKTFKGKFYGNGKTLKNYTVNTSYPYTNMVGLFFNTKGATISNITFENVNINVPSCPVVGIVVGKADNKTKISKIKIINATVVGSNNVGGIVGNFRGKYIKNCKLTNVTVSGSSSVGGVAGYVNSAPRVNKKARVEKCYFDGKVTGTSSVGGIVGKLESTNRLSRISGIYNSETSDTTTVTGKTSIGGIVGEVLVGRLEKCTNNAEVICNFNDGENIGGVIGLYHVNYYNDSGLDKGYFTITLSDLVNKGKITINSGSGIKRVGGIAGFTYMSIYDDNKDHKITFKNCKNLVDIDAYASGVGGLIGVAQRGSSSDYDGSLILKNCTQKGNVKGKNEVGMLIGSGYWFDFKDSGTTIEGTATGTGLYIGTTDKYGYWEN